MEEVHIDDELDAMEAKARAWDMLTRSLTFESPEDDTEFAYELRGKMELLLKIAQEKEEDM